VYSGEACSTSVRSADNEARDERGIDENSGFGFRIRQLRFVERSVWSSRLGGEHQLGSRHRLDWSVTGSGVIRREPDRSETVYATDPEGGAPFLLQSDESAVRTFGDLREWSFNGGGGYALSLGAPGREHALKLGGLFRYTSREADNRSYNISATLPREEREQRPEVIFGDRYIQDGSSVFRIAPLSQGGQYDARDVLGAGYGIIEYQLGERFRLIGGARVERWDLRVSSQETFETRPSKAHRTNTDVLPSATLNVKVTETQNLRVSASQTLARPEYREIARVRSRDIIGGEEFRGNPDLERTLIQNADVRWEWYPNAGEVLSVGVFAKHFDDPIERVYRGTSGTRVTTFENAAGANNYGAELEVRKGLGFLHDELAPLTVFSNVTVMRSEIDLSNVSAGSVDETRPMVGQAPYVVNAGLTYASGSGRTSATVLYNVVGRRIFQAALNPLPNVYEEARHVVDVSLRVPVMRRVSLKLDAKNLLDEPYEITQGTVRRDYFRAGRVFAAGMSWRP
jgi:TonB-dependent receptor